VKLGLTKIQIHIANKFWLRKESDWDLEILIENRNQTYSDQGMDPKKNTEIRTQTKIANRKLPKNIDSMNAKKIQNAEVIEEIS